MSEKGTMKVNSKPKEPEFVVSLEYEPAEDAEDRLLRAYELLLGTGDSPETCSGEGELT